MAALGPLGCAQASLWSQWVGAALHCGAWPALRWPLLLGARGLRGVRASAVAASGLGSCSSRLWSSGSVLVALGLVALGTFESSQTRDGT